MSEGLAKQVIQFARPPVNTQATDTKPVNKPWRTPVDEKIREHLEGTLLMPILAAAESVTNPPLPLAIVLPQVLALVGCALSGPAPSWNDPTKRQGKVGADIARVRINTAGGQVPNIYALIVAPSTYGKDIGNVVPRLAGRQEYLLGTTASAEGFADALILRPNGLFIIDELQPYLRERSWQHALTNTLTSLFNRGHFRYKLSKRAGAKERFSPFAYPNVIAKVQPEVLQHCAQPTDVQSGFLPRFLVGCPAQPGCCRPSTRRLDLDAAQDALRAYHTVAGDVEVPEGYLGDVLQEFIHGGASLGSHYMRLVNEYGPRFALMLSARRGVEQTVITHETWCKVADLVRWFYTMAERVFEGLEGEAWQRRREAQMGKFLQYIRRHGQVTRSQLSRDMGRNTTAPERLEMIEELRERGKITITEQGNGAQVYCAIPQEGRA